MDWYSSELLEGVEECPFSLEPEKVRVIALATITLHNWLQKDSYGKVYIPSVSGLVDNEEVATAEITEGTRRKDPATESQFSMFVTKANNPTKEAKAVREEFNKYFFNEGSVPWQWCYA